MLSLMITELMRKEDEKKRHDEINLDKKASFWCPEVIIDNSNGIYVEEAEKNQKKIHQFTCFVDL